MAEAVVANVTVTRGARLHAAPVVSVVIPAYQSTTLDEALDSVRAQTFDQYELIVVDDGSTSPQRPAEAADLLLIRQANGGPGVARNTGAAYARGRWLAFLDSDDRWRPDKLAAQLALHEAQPDWVLSATDGVFVTPEGRELGRNTTRYGLRGGLVSYATLFRENCLATSTCLCDRAAFEAVGGFDPRRTVNEDYALWLRLGRRGPVGYLDQVLVEHVDHDASFTAAGLRQQRWHAMELATYRSILDEFPELAGEPFVRQALARVEFDRGWELLQAEDWPAAAAAFAACVRQQPSRAKAWLNWLRARLHRRPR